MVCSKEMSDMVKMTQQAGWMVNIQFRVLFEILKEGIETVCVRRMVRSRLFHTAIRDIRDDTATTSFVIPISGGFDSKVAISQVQ